MVRDTPNKGEQASAGLDRCSAKEYQRFQDLNAAYWAKFDFPFILAVRGRGRVGILFEALGTDDAIAVGEHAKGAPVTCRDPGFEIACHVSSQPRKVVCENE